MARDLSIFVSDNARWKAARRRVPWDERLRLIREQFPVTASLDGHTILREDDALARLIRDILKIDQIEPGRAGPRPGLDYERGMQSWRELFGQDYAEVPFPEAFRSLTRGNSLTTIARKTNISRSRVHQLLRGERSPTIDDLRLIAEAYGKRPQFFCEYRAEFIMAIIAERLNKEPETTIAVYRKLVQ